MKDIITDLTKLHNISEKIVLKNEKGLVKTEAEEIMKELIEVFNSNKDINSLSAPQIGINKRIFGIRFKDTIKFFINPIITRKVGNSIQGETCSSMPNKEILVGRPTEIRAVYYNENFVYEDNKFLDFAAKIFDQQVNFLDGITPEDIGLVSDVTVDGHLADLSEAELKEAIEIYKKFIQIKLDTAENLLKTESGLEDEYRRLKFTEKVIKDEIQVIDDTPAIKMNRAQRRAVAKKKRK